MSAFYSARFEHLFPISLLAFERLAALSHLPAEEGIPLVLAECCNKPNPTEAEVVYFLERVQIESAAAQERVDDTSSQKRSQPSKSLGTAFQEFLGQMDSARLLIWACGRDYEKAQYIYTSVDRSIATQIIDDFLRLQQEQNTYLYESILYGFGGGYKEDSSGEEIVDMTDMDASSIMKMLSN